MYNMMNHVDPKKEPDVFLAVVRGRVMGLTQPEAYAAARMKMSPAEYLAMKNFDLATGQDHTAIAQYNCRCAILDIALLKPKQYSTLSLAAT